MIEQIRAGALKNPATPMADVGYGPRYQLDVMVTGPNGEQHNVRSGWIVDKDGTRLTSIYGKDLKS